MLDQGLLDDLARRDVFFPPRAIVLGSEGKSTGSGVGCGPAEQHLVIQLSNCAAEGYVPGRRAVDCVGIVVVPVAQHLRVNQVRSTNLFP